MFEWYRFYIIYVILIILEDLNEYAGKPLDIWSFGITIFILTYREFPFKTKNSGNMMEIYDLISNAE